MKLERIIVLSLALGIAGCTTDTKKVLTEGEKIVESAPVGKPSAPISMNYKVLTENPKPGQEIEIQIEFSSTISSSISAEMKAAKDLTWINSEKTWEVSMSKSGESKALPSLKVSASENGMYYVYLMASITDNGKKLYKPFTIPVKVGNGELNLESPGEIQVDDKGQRVIIQKGESDN